MCPKCRRHNTYDYIPEMPNQHEPQLQADNFFHEIYSIGNAKYYCIDCNYKWKKYMGKKPYERIRVIIAYVGGYPGPYCQVKIDLAEQRVEHNTDYPFSDGLPVNDSSYLLEEDIELFLTELHKCDFVNWAEEYNTFGPVMDGTHWSVRIEFDTHCEIKTGDNHFPPKWTKFCKAISKLSGNEFY
ncbi:hypothetical protein SAMN05192533_103252 [Mesobacillus persicus]|uniref:Uncharacterized protein n=1 Tax=Mesobacillus persicus TaxID=930146 RepID=A0A1H7Z5L5_9BACI|nr:hypothetical protein [Mesobacillus persicus]SEM52769.1 hypothetical protein SAMN05192533_103252 [Mesobacillus persicus]